MPYLILQDYFATIQDAALQQILCDEDAFRLTKQETALAEIKSYLTQKYDVSDEFRETVKFSYDCTYKAKQLVYLDATVYSITATYTTGTLVLQAGYVYYNSTAITVGEAFTLSKWTLLGKQYTLFYVPVPEPEFNYKSFYSVDDLVFWKDKIYKARQGSANTSQSSNLQFDSYSDVPYINQFPDSAFQTQWTVTDDNYAITGVWPTDEVYTEGDNRNPQLVEMNVFISIYKLSPRISPRNIPDIWVKNYDDAISWLKKCAKGDVTLDAPLIQPLQGKRIRYGSHTKKINGY